MQIYFDRECDHLLAWWLPSCQRQHLYSIFILRHGHHAQIVFDPSNSIFSCY